ncbi:MAG: alpha/beta hydrolase [Selenomonas sp.]|nr:alpha/beta hydrolase [Selenomonas sp.]
MLELVIYIHGKGGSAEESEHYRALFPEAEVLGFDYQSQTPWEAEAEFQAYYDKVTADHGPVCVIANSIGAFFAMCALGGKKIHQAFFISPIADMEKLILNMMSWAKVTEAELREKKEIATDFGEKLSWEYLNYVRRNPQKWAVPTHVLYGANDHLMPREVITGFVEKNGGTLTVMEGGEHWFHTEEQMAFLDKWIMERRW